MRMRGQSGEERIGEKKSREGDEMRSVVREKKKIKIKLNKSLPLDLS